MGAYDQITRIKNNVTNSLSVVQEKGVSVPAGANSDNLPGLIAQISGGDASVEEITNEAGGKSVYINSEVPKLPDGFTRLKYIQSSGSQYIKTGYTPNSNTRVVLDAYNLSTGSGWTFGAWTSSSSLQYAFSCNASYSFRYGSTGVSLTSVPVGSLKVDFNKNAYNLNGTAGTLTVASFTCAYPMYLFAINAAGSVSSGKFTGQVMSCQIYDNGSLVRDYVPCRNASGEAGLYDFVDGVFYGDAAGVGFVAGSVVLDYTLPEGYEELNYIESTGSQYVNTGFVPNQDTRLDIVSTPLSADDAGAGNGFIPYGAATGYNSNAFECYSASSQYEFNYDGQYDFIGTAVVNKLVTISHNKNIVSMTVEGAGQFSKTFTYNSFTAPYTLTLFAIHRSSVTCGKLRLHSCQIYDNGTIVRYYVPCRTNTGEVGLWDAVNSVFYGDASGVGFIAGSVVTPGVSKVVLEDEVLIDLTGDTVTPESLLSGFTAHNAMGQLIHGAASAGRSFASGSFTPTSNVTTMTISGLSFTPKIVLVVAGDGGMPWISNSQSAFAVNAHDVESGLMQHYYGFVDDYGYISGAGVRTSGITLNADGFKGYINTYTLYRSGVRYYWYAIG